MADQEKKVFVSGTNGYKAKYGYVVSFNVDDFKKYLDEHNEKGWVKVHFKESKDKLDKFQRQVVYGEKFVAQAQTQTTQAPIEDDGLKF